MFVPQVLRIRALADVDEAGMNQLVGTSRRDDKSRVQRVKRKRAPRESRLIALKYIPRDVDTRGGCAIRAYMCNNPGSCDRQV